MELNGTNQHLAYADDDNTIGENIKQKKKKKKKKIS
jgi:hypothetical protein